MKNIIKIILLVFLISSSFFCSSQTEHGLLPFSSKLLLNPSFAGFNRSTSTWSNLQYFSQQPKEINHSFTITYDTWSEKLATGIAVYFYQGLRGEVNTIHTGAGFSFSKPIEFLNGELIPSLNLNYLIYSKQWLVYVLDGVLDLERDDQGNLIYQPPGENHMVYDEMIPRMGLMWNSPALNIGFSASRYHLFEQENLIPKAHFVFHATQKMRGKRNGLESKPIKASPELVILYSNDLLLSRAGFRMEQVNSLMAVFVQNNYSDNVHGIAGVLGWKSEHINASMTVGGAYAISQKKPSLFGEFSLGFVLPYQYTNHRNPWAPPENSY